MTSALATHVPARPGGEPRQALSGVARVLHVLNGLPFGGNETLCLQLLANLPSDERWVLNVGDDGPMRQRIEELQGSRIFDVPYRRTHRLRFLWRTWLLLRRLRPQAVVIGPFGLHVLVGLAARLAGVKRILARAGNPPPLDAQRRWLWAWILRASVLLRIPIISCSRYVEGELRRLTRLPSRSRPIQNGIDTAAVRVRAASARARRVDVRPVVGMVARLSAIKDHATLLRALARLRARHPDLQAWIVGDGELGPQLEILADQLHLFRTVTFLGKRADIAELLGQMDVFVFSTTRDEGFGIAIAEAMAAGLPVVASDVPPCREVVGDAGLLVPPGDPVELAETVDRLLRDPGARSRLSERAVARAEVFSVERCAGEWSRCLIGGEADA